jgi:malate dehydrogenase (oxaloacetate-decarboxylating)
MTTHSPARAHGAALLADPLLNKGTAFSSEERAELGLDGLLPPATESLEEQADRAYEAFLGYDKPLNRHIYLRQLQDTNEVLFYSLLTRHLEEMLPVVYTPTVGEACRRFSEIYRRPRGLFLTYEDRHRFREILRNRPGGEVDVIVVTDGQRILGLGDQGVGGMGIPIGKLSLYTAIGGIHPARTLPVLLDAGTDNEQLLAGEHYLGRRRHRVTGDAYDEMIEAFVSAVEAELPGTLLQWEDFATAHARPILSRYQDQLLTFNDDIQGTAAVALGALSTATKVAGTSLTDHRIVVLGAGSAAAPTITPPAVGWSSRGPKSGSSSPASIRCCRPAGPPRRKNAGPRPDPDSPYRKTGKSSSSPMRRPRASAVSRAAPISPGRSGTTGTTSAAPVRG